MRRSTLRRSSRFESDAERWKSVLRSVQWASYYERFFGGMRGSDQIPSSYAPTYPRQLAGVLEAACGCKLPQREQRVRQDALRRTLSQMQLAGQVLGEGQHELLNAVARLVEEDGTTPTAQSAVAATAPDLLAEEPFRRRAFSLEEELANHERSDLPKPVSIPIRVTHRGDAFSVEKHVYLRQPVSLRVKRLVNPLNWTKLGEYFTTTERADRRKTTAAHRGPTSWRGVLREVFTVSWNEFTTQKFDQRLEIDYTVLPNLARTDYFLMYEQDDQIVLNEGYFEAKEDVAHPDWMSVTMVKTLRFRSSLLNLLTPAILAMVLDSKAGGFTAFVERRAQARENSFRFRA